MPRAVGGRWSPQVVGGGRVLVSLRAYAKHRGCRLSAVQKAIKTGRIQRTPEGLVDVDQADAAWRRNTDPAKQSAEKLVSPAVSKDAAGGRRVEIELEPQPHGGALKRERATGEDPEDSDAAVYLKARAEKEQTESELKKLELAEKTGELVPAADVEKVWGEMIVTARNRALMLPAELAPRLALESDEVACQQILRDGIYRVLSELAEPQPHA